MRLGLHVGIKHGLLPAVDYAQRLGCTALQIFSSNPRTYRPPRSIARLSRAFAERCAAAGIAPAVIHTSYLINLASDDPKITRPARCAAEGRSRSGGGGRDRLRQHAPGLVRHARPQRGLRPGRARAGSALASIPPGVTLVMENSAGAGNLCGGTLEELGAFVRALDHPQLGVCLDTAHSWAAGYEINSQAGVDAFVALAAREIGLERVNLFHFNDTQIPLGGHRDRHYHIGEGLIGFEGFRALAAHPELRGKAAILETPGDEADDARNMQTIRLIFEGAGV
jgi:deoxyribonuclease-4